MNDVDIKNDLIKSVAQFTFELEGKSEIDAKALSQILDGTVSIIEEIVRTEPDAYVNLKVTKFSTGSFDIDFQAVAEQTITMLSEPDALASYIVGGVLASFQIAKHIKGKKPKQIINHEDTSEIINHENISLKVLRKNSDNYFNNSTIDNSVYHIVNVISQETDRPGFRIKQSEDRIVEYSNLDCVIIKPVVSDDKTEIDQVFTNTFPVTLIIRKPDLMGGSKWGFIFERNIDATIEDKDWLIRIREEKIKFGPGMRLPVILRVDVDLDITGQAIKGSERYTVVEITGEIIEPDDKNHQISIEHQHKS